jgi:hypothetical protein
VPRQAKPMGLLQPVRALLFLAAFLLADPAAADSHRSSKAVRQFRALQPPFLYRRDSTNRWSVIGNMSSNHQKQPIYK